VLADDETVIANLIVEGLASLWCAMRLARARASEGELVAWPGVAIETTLWFVCLAERATEPALAALLDMCARGWHLHGAPTATAT